MGCPARRRPCCLVYAAVTWSKTKRPLGRLAVQYPDLSFLLPDGVCYRGHTVRGGKPGTSGPLSLKRELRELTPKIAAAETSLREALAMASRAEDEIENQKHGVGDCQVRMPGDGKTVTGRRA